MTTKNLGEILIEQGVIDREALDRALQIQNRRLGDILIQERLADPVAIAQALKFQARARSHRRTGRLSVDASRLDELLQRLEFLEDQITTKSAASAPLLASVVSLRESLEMLLLEPVDTLFERARFILAQALVDTGKKAELVCEGGALVIDRALLDELSDMVLHLTRNAIDHGIETDQLRGAASKPPTGTVRICVATYGGRLLLTVSDDGAGIDDEAVYSVAKAKGFVDKPREAFSREALHHILFTPGFSTLNETSPLSGRGVGLDVVEAAAIRMGGEVTVRSEPGRGATFLVSVPLSYARLSILPLRAGSEWLAVNASEILRIEQVDSPAGLLSARSLFPAESGSGHSASHTDSARAAARSFINERAVGARSIVKVECIGGSKWAFDEVGQAEDVLVREASAFAKGSHGVTGGARLRHGRSVLLVDLNLLATIAQAAQTPLV